MEEVKKLVAEAMDFAYRLGKLDCSIGYDRMGSGDGLDSDEAAERIQNTIDHLVEAQSAQHERLKSLENRNTIEGMSNAELTARYRALANIMIDYHVKLFPSDAEGRENLARALMGEIVQPDERPVLNGED